MCLVRRGEYQTAEDLDKLIAVIEDESLTEFRCVVDGENWNAEIR